MDPCSACVAAFNAEVERELETGEGPSISTSSYSVPIYTVPAGQPVVRVGLTSQLLAPSLTAAWAEVPLPATALPARGSDAHLVVWQPSSGKLWEFWRLAQSETGWQAGWGGAIDSVSSDLGVYGPDAWPGATRSWGASASSLSIAGGLITFEDLQRGKIDHALAIAIPDVRTGVYAAPAQRTDGTSHDPLTLPEGAHLRLDPSLDLSKLGLRPVTLMIAEAAQKYGLIVRDGAGNTTLYAQDPTPTGTNPYSGRNGFFEGSYPAQLLSTFPWRHLELLEMHLSPIG